LSDLTNRSSPKRTVLSHVSRSSLLIAVLFGLDKLMGVFRQVVIGRQFGISRELDAFNAANNLPDLLFAIISGGALAIAFIPVLSAVIKQDGRPAAWELFSRVANWAVLITSGFALLIALFAGPIVRARIGIAPGFTPELQTLVIELMRLNLISTLIFSVSGLVIAGLQSNKHFFLPALAPLFYDLGQIFGALILAPETGYSFAGITLPAAGLGVHGLVYGVILGAALHLGIQIPGLLRFRFRWSPKLGWENPHLRKVAHLMAPRILTIGTFQLIFVLQDNLASRLGTGSITALAYGWLIMQVPETIIGTAIGTAILPTLSDFFAQGDDSKFEESVARAVRVVLALTLPAAALLMIGIGPLIGLLFNFGEEGTLLVLWAARAYLVGLMGHALLEIAARAYYARQNARLPLIAAAISALSFFAFSLILFRPLGAAGIGLSNSLAFTLEAVFLLVMLGRVFPSILRQSRTFIRIVLGTLVGSAGAVLILLWGPGSELIAALASMAGGALLTIPFIWSEVRELLRL
jgi:putative peptidoglycan lipid II flippase